ncbi:MAG: nickel transporter [Actinomycetota bacterium]|nr:nickel transporter [Actinomycetota bacterium]
MTRARVAALIATATIGVGLVTALSPVASAHPLGNFTHNTYVGFSVSTDSVAVDHVLDLAEIPTFQERSAMDADGDGAVSSAEADAWATARCAAAATRIVATTDLGPVAWSTGPATITFPEGEGGLPTTRLECGLSADVAGARTFEANVDVAQGRAGWHEITAVGDGIAVTSGAPDSSPSQRLTAYPVDGSTMDVTSVAIGWGGAGGIAGVAAAGAPAAALQPPVSDPASATASALAPIGLDGAARAFTDLIGRQDVTVGFALLAVLIAVFLGGLHAMAPGHGKTMMAAALVGTTGRRRDAFALGASVTVSHTAGVVILAVALTLSSAVAAESAYPWLGLASAVIAVAVGVSLLRQARRGGHAHSHPHPHAHDHDHDDHAPGHPGHDHHDHGHDEHRHDDHGQHDHGHDAAPGALRVAARSHAPVVQRPATRRFVALGLAGGLVPSPSAVVVLLAGFALGRSWFALLLVVAYGMGMALTLCLTGLVLVRAGGLSRRVAAGAAVPLPIAAALRLLPVIAAVTVVAAGLWLGFRSILAM